MMHLFSWRGRDTGDLYAISLFKMFGLMILSFVGAYFIIRAQLDTLFLELWNWFWSLVILVAFLLSSMRRLRDAGRGAAFMLIFAVPILGVCLFGYLLFAKSRAKQERSEPMA